MGAAVEVDDDTVGGYLDPAGGFHELAIELLGLGLGKAVQLVGQPAVAAVGDHREGNVEIDVESDFTGQAIEVKEVHADAQAVLDAVAAGVAQHQVAWGDLEVVGQKQRIAFAAQASHSDLTQGAIVTLHCDGFVDVANVLVQAFGNVEMGLVPGARGQAFEAPGDGSTPAANGHERDAALVETSEFGVAGELGIEVQPLGIATGDAVPEGHEAEDLAGLVVAGEVGVGVAQNAAFLLLGEEGEHAGAGLAAQGQVVVVQASGVAAIGNGVEVEVEGFRFREQQRRQLGDPGGEELFLLGTLGAIGGIGDEGFLGRNVEAGPETQCLVEVEVIDVTTAFFVDEFQDQETEQSADRRDHSRSRIASVVDEAVEAELGQERQEQESPRDTRADGALRSQGERAAIGDSRSVGTRRGVTRAGTSGSSARRGNEKGGTGSAWQ